MIVTDYKHFHALTDGLYNDKNVLKYYMLHSTYADPDNEDDVDPEVIAVCDFNRTVVEAMRKLAKDAELDMWYISNEANHSVPF